MIFYLPDHIILIIASAVVTYCVLLVLEVSKSDNVSIWYFVYVFRTQWPKEIL